MRRIDISELPNQSTEQIRSGETYAVERDGEVLGYLVPTKRTDPEELRQAFERLNRTIDETLRDGYTREQLADDLDLSKPFAEKL